MATSYGLQTRLKKKKTADSTNNELQALQKENANLKRENTKLKKIIKEASDNGKGTTGKNSSGNSGASETK